MELLDGFLDSLFRPSADVDAGVPDGKLLEGGISDARIASGNKHHVSRQVGHVTLRPLRAIVFARHCFVEVARGLNLPVLGLLIFSNLKVQQMVILVVDGNEALPSAIYQTSDLGAKS